MAYSPQSFEVLTVLTTAQMNQVETNIRDHVHGSNSVIGLSVGGLIRAEVIMVNSGTTTIPGSTVTLMTCSIGPVTSGDLLTVALHTRLVKGATGGVTGIRMDGPQTEFGQNIGFFLDEFEASANANLRKAYYGQGRITSNIGGTTLLLKGNSAGSDTTCNSGNLQMSVFVWKRTLP